jgi:hypothetical protein
MVHGNLNDYKGAYYICSFEDNTMREVDSKTVGQFADLKDKNGVEIYEGDILGGDKFSLPVKFHQYQGRWFANNEGAYIVWGHKFKLFEVTGNIHQHPELIGE